MTANLSPMPLVSLAPHAPLFATLTASASITHRSLSWEMRRDWMPAVSDGKEGTAFYYCFTQTCRSCLTHTVHKDTAIYKLAHK